MFAVHGAGRVTFGLVTTAGESFRGPRGRRIAGSVEHSAPLARGSSGGPLVDPAGNLVGLNTNRVGEGFYLALPADSALRIPKPARALIAIPSPIPWWWWALGALAALVIGLLAWWWTRRNRRTGIGTGDPYAEAMTAFGRVEKLHLVEAGEPGRHAALMTDVLRRYLSDRFEHVSLAQTSGELLHAMRAVPTVSHNELRALLVAVDPVKFAAAPLAADRARALGDEAKRIVRDEHERATALAVADADVPKERAA